MSEPDTSDRITVYSDYICPFCYLGRQSLSRYREDREGELEIDWRPFDLRARKRGPDGEIVHDIDDGKGEEYYAEARENVRRLQERYDVEMELELATEIDSLDAQVASYHVRQEYPYGRWLEFDEAIFEALWQEGRDIGDSDVIVDLAEDVGLDPDEIRSVLDDEELRETINERFDEARQRGISGVPTFVYGEHAARGAVPPEQLRRLIEGT